MLSVFNFYLILSGTFLLLHVSDRDHVEKCLSLSNAWLFGFNIVTLVE